MAMGLGDKLNTVGFLLALFGGIATLAGGAFMYVGTGLTGESVWQNLKKVQRVAEQASVRHEAEWTPRQRIELGAYVPPTASHINLAFFMQSKDVRTPLKMLLSTRDDGGVMGFASGEQGEVELMLDGSAVYVSVSHPSISWSLSPKGWTDTL